MAKAEAMARALLLAAALLTSTTSASSPFGSLDVAVRAGWPSGPSSLLLEAR